MSNTPGLWDILVYLGEVASIDLVVQQEHQCHNQQLVVVHLEVVDNLLVGVDNLLEEEGIHLLGVEDNLLAVEDILGCSLKSKK